jgi:PilZ domain-containing protein/DnaJ-like protein
MNTEYSSPQLQAHFLELERVLERIEAASTLYQVLALKRSATAENMRDAYRQTWTLLNPSLEKHNHLDPNLQARIKRALDKVANAFSVLTNFGKRVEYDNSLVNRDRVPLPRDPVPLPKNPVPKSPVPLSVDVPEAKEANLDTKIESADFNQRAGSAIDSEVIKIKPSRMHEAIYTKPAEQMPSTERRSFKRSTSRFPARVIGHDRVNGKWDEVAETINMSKGGVALRMKKSVRLGMVLLLTLPLPVKLRCYGYSEPFYRVYGIVCQVRPTPDGKQWIVGLEFLGEFPPAGYREKPWATFKTAL